MSTTAKFTDIWIEVPDSPLFSYSREASELSQSKQSVKSLRHIKTNLSTIDLVPSMSRARKFGSLAAKRRRYGLAALVIGSGIAIITILLSVFLLNLTKNDQTTSSSSLSSSTTTKIIIAAAANVTITSASIATTNIISTFHTTMTSTSTTTSDTTFISTCSTNSTSTTSSTSDTSSTSTTSDTSSTSTTSSTSDTTSTSTTSDTSSTSTTSSTSDTTSTSTTSTTSSTSGTTSTSTTSTTDTSTSTSSTTTTTTSVTDSSSLWSFDGNTLDCLSTFHGTSVNSSTYITPGINGYGSALSLNGSTGQFVNVSTYRNISYTSFTVELWFYPTHYSGGAHGFFGQRDVPTNDRSLHLQIAGNILFMGFWSDDLKGATNGNRSTLPYKGKSGSIVIGKTEQSPGTPNYFYGYLDEVSLVMRVKNASEILDDATLTTYHSFDTTPTYSDSGPLHLNVTANNISSASGIINQAISFTSNNSYYQMGGFVLLGTTNYSYSISLWVNPTSIRGSTLVHLSTTMNGQGWCLDLIGFSSTGQIVIINGNTSAQRVTGPVLPPNVWTHVASTYSQTNKLCLYVNGTLVSTSTSALYAASGQVNILTLGNVLQGIPYSAGGTCTSQSIVPGVYSGSIDEFRVYSRELNSTDIYALANP